MLSPRAGAANWYGQWRTRLRRWAGAHSTLRVMSRMNLHLKDFSTLRVRLSAACKISSTAHANTRGFRCGVEWDSRNKFEWHAPRVPAYRPAHDRTWLRADH